MKTFKSLYGFGGRCLKIRDVCMDFEPYFKVHNLISIYPKSIKLGQMTNLNMIFHVMVSVYRLVKIWNSPQFPAEFRNGLLGGESGQFVVIYCCNQVISLECWKVIGFASTSLHDWLKNSRHFFVQSNGQIKTNCDSLTHVFPCFASATSNSSIDWFTGLSVTFVIG